MYLISFDFKFNRNRNFSEEPLIKLLNNLKGVLNHGLGVQKKRTEETLLKNYDEFLGLIQNFGMGMLIFPSLINEL